MNLFIKINLRTILAYIFLQSIYAYAFAHHINYCSQNRIDTITINVKNTGASGDGLQDDYPAIAKALSQTKNAVKIYFPSGTYLIKHTLTTTHEGTVFVFDKNAKLILADNIIGGILIKHNNCKVINGYFEGNNISSNNFMQGFGILLVGVSNCQILNSTFDKISGMNIFLINNDTTGCKKCTIQGNRITEPAFDRTIVQDAAGIMLGYSGTGYFHTNNLIANNTIDGNEKLAHGIALIMHGNGNIVSKNFVKNCTRYGIVIYEAKYENLKLTHNDVLYNTIQHIGTPNGKPSTYGMGIYLMKDHYSLIKGNLVSDCLLNTDNSETLPSGAITLNGATYCTVEQNVISNSYKYGIACSMTFHSNIINNSIDTTGKSGIYLINTAFNLVKGNTIKNTDELAIKGLFGNIGRSNYAVQMTIKDYQNLSTGQGVEIVENKIYSKKQRAILFMGEDPDNKTNYSGNKVNNIYIHNNTLTGNLLDNSSISLYNADGTTNKILNNKFSKK